MISLLNNIINIDLDGITLTDKPTMIGNPRDFETSVQYYNLVREFIEVISLTLMEVKTPITYDEFRTSMSGKRNEYVKIQPTLINIVMEWNKRLNMVHVVPFRFIVSEEAVKSLSLESNYHLTFKEQYRGMVYQFSQRVNMPHFNDLNKLNSYYIGVEIVAEPLAGTLNQIINGKPLVFSDGNCNVLINITTMPKNRLAISYSSAKSDRSDGGNQDVDNLIKKLELVRKHFCADNFAFTYLLLQILAQKR